MTLEDDIITVNDDKEYSTRDRTIFLKQPLDGSWIVCAVVKEMGDGKNKSQPIILGKLSKKYLFIYLFLFQKSLKRTSFLKIVFIFAGICRMRDKSHFEQNANIKDITNEEGTISLDLRELENDEKYVFVWNYDHIFFQ